MKEASSLLEKYRRGECTEEELDLLYAWFHELHADEPNQLAEDELIEARTDFESAILQKSKPLIPWRKVVAAAAAVVIVGFLTYYMIYSPMFNGAHKASMQEAVVLILDDGHEINLSDAKDGVLAKDLGVTVRKTASGKLQYRFDGNAAVSSEEIKFHTLQTPIGETYEIVLEDGSVLSLNAQSKVRFPTSFKGLPNRDIELSGEAYFEVAKAYKDKQKTALQPFRVHAKEQRVEVLGTAFNINAYADESSVKTTLMHGVVKVEIPNGGASVLLNERGQQAVMRGGKLAKVQVELGNELAWQRGKILLQDQDIYSIMRAIGRWYPIEVVYKDDFKGDLFGGVLSKGKSLEEILKLVQETGEVKFKLEPAQGDKKERRVTVMK